MMLRSLSITLQNARGRNNQETSNNNLESRDPDKMALNASQYKYGSFYK
jgi:hypothetical protein